MRDNSYAIVSSFLSVPCARQCVGDQQAGGLREAWDGLGTGCTSTALSFL